MLLISYHFLHHGNGPSKRNNERATDENYALWLDSEDPLAKFRSRFYIPKETIYVDGNSLGLLSKDAEKSLLRVLNEWKTLGIHGWSEAERPWFYFGEELGAMAAPLVGAEPEEVVTTGTTTLNLHSLVSTFYQPKGKKTKILADELNFPSDVGPKSPMAIPGRNEADCGILAAVRKSGCCLNIRSGQQPSNLGYRS